MCNQQPPLGSHTDPEMEPVYVFGKHIIKQVVFCVHLCVCVCVCLCVCERDHALQPLQFFSAVNTQKEQIRHNLHNLPFMYQSVDPIRHMDWYVCVI